MGFDIAGLHRSGNSSVTTKTFGRWLTASQPTCGDLGSCPRVTVGNHRGKSVAPCVPVVISEFVALAAAWCVRGFGLCRTRQGAGRRRCRNDEGRRSRPSIGPCRLAPGSAGGSRVRLVADQPDCRRAIDVGAEREVGLTVWSNGFSDLCHVEVVGWPTARRHPFRKG